MRRSIEASGPVGGLVATSTAIVGDVERPGRGSRVSRAGLAAIGSCRARRRRSTSSGGRRSRSRTRSRRSRAIDHARVRRRACSTTRPASSRRDVETGYQWVCGLWECPPGPQHPEKPWQVPADEVDAAGARAVRDGSRCGGSMPTRRTGNRGSRVARAIRRGPRVIEWWTNRRTPMAPALEGYDTGDHGRAISHDGEPA